MTRETGEVRRKRSLFGLLTAEALSMTGSQVSFVTVPWLVLVTTGSAAHTGLVGFAEILPYVLAGLLGGPLIDRLGPARAAIVADAVSAVVVGLIPLLYLSGALPYGALIGVVAVAGTLRGFGDTAKRTLLPRAIEASGVSMSRGTALYDGISRGSMLLGLPAAGVLIVWLGPATVLVLDAVSFLCCAILVATLVRVGGPARSGPERPEEGYLLALRAGIGYLRRDRLVLAMVAMLFATNLFDQANGAVFVPVWVHEVLRSPAALGLVGGAFGLGAVLGNLVYAALAPRLPRYATFSVCFLLGGSTRLFALALTNDLWIVLTVSLAAGFVMSTVNPILSATAYERIPQHLQGRVLGALGALSWAGIPLGGLFAGWLVAAFGLRAGLLVAAVGYLAVTLMPVVIPIWRQLDPEAGIRGDERGGVQEAVGEKKVVIPVEDRDV